PAARTARAASASSTARASAAAAAPGAAAGRRDRRGQRQASNDQSATKRGNETAAAFVMRFEKGAHRRSFRLRYGAQETRQPTNYSRCIFGERQIDKKRLAPLRS